MRELTLVIKAEDSGEIRFDLYYNNEFNPAEILGLLEMSKRHVVKGEVKYEPDN